MSIWQVAYVVEVLSWSKRVPPASAVVDELRQAQSAANWEAVMPS